MSLDNNKKILYGVSAAVTLFIADGAGLYSWIDKFVDTKAQVNDVYADLKAAREKSHLNASEKKYCEAKADACQLMVPHTAITFRDLLAQPCDSYIDLISSAYDPCIEVSTFLASPLYFSSVEPGLACIEEAIKCYSTVRE